MRSVAFVSPLGSMDCLLRIFARDMASYERFFFEKRSSIPGVQEVNSAVSLSQAKAPTVLPLR
jgi:Lrp/AsnC family transcriptional regulator